MKKIILSTILLAMTSVSFAQDSLNTNTAVPVKITSWKPVDGDHVLSFGVLNNTAFWARKSYRANQFAVRMGITGSYYAKPTNTQEITTTDPSGVVSVSSTSNSERNFAIGIYKGVQKGFGDLERVEPYIGWDIGFTYSNQYRESAQDSEFLPYRSETTSKSPANFNLGFMPLVGVNYYITPKLAIGAEYRFTIFNVGYTVDSKQETKNIDRTTGAVTTIVTEQKTGNFNFGGSFTGQAYVTVSLTLGNCHDWCKKK